MTRRAWFLFAGVSILWGIPFLFIKIAVEEVSPATVAWGRLAIGTAVLLPVAWRFGALRGLRPRLGKLAIFAALELAIPFSLIAWGERHVSSSIAGILVSALPLIVAVLALRFDRSDRLSGTRVTGLVMGFAGVVLLVGLDLGGEVRELLGAASILVATVGYAAGALIVKRWLSDLDPLGPIAVALGLSTVMLTPFAVASRPTATPSTGAILSIVVLGLACSAIALLLYFALITEVGPGRASVITYVNPVVAVALGLAFLGEHVSGVAIAGVLLILTGSWLSTRGSVPAAILAGSTAIRGRFERAPNRWRV